MTEDETDRQFREIADAFIDLANKQAEQAPAENVGMAMLYAASRFNAYVVALHADDLEKYEKDVPEAENYFKQQYGNMLQENIEDYKKVYQPQLKYEHLMKKEK